MQIYKYMITELGLKDNELYLYGIILDDCEQKGECVKRIKDFAKILNITEATVRANIQKLLDKHYIMRNKYHQSYKYYICEVTDKAIPRKIPVAFIKF